MLYIISRKIYKKLVIVVVFWEGHCHVQETGTKTGPASHYIYPFVNLEFPIMCMDFFFFLVYFFKSQFQHLSAV